MFPKSSEIRFVWDEELSIGAEGATVVLIILVSSAAEHEEQNVNMPKYVLSGHLRHLPNRLGVCSRHLQTYICRALS